MGGDCPPPTTYILSICLAIYLFICILTLCSLMNVTELSERLQVFIQDKTEEYYRQQDQQAIQNLKNGIVNIDDLAAAWTNKYSQVIL